MIKLFTHTDLDGIACAVLARLCYGNGVDITYTGYADIDFLINKHLSNNEYSETHITDLGIKKETAKLIDDSGQDIRLWDHHISNIEDMASYSWAKVKDKLLDSYTYRTCGVEMYYFHHISYVLEDILSEESLREVNTFINLVRDYDTWVDIDKKVSNLSPKDLNSLLYIMGREDFIKWVIDRILNEGFGDIHSWVSTTLGTNSKLEELYISEKNASILEMGLLDENDGHLVRFGVVFADKYISVLGNELAKKNPKFDFIVIINMTHGRVSYRTIKDDVDVSKIAARFGGGGHKQAAGSEIDPDDITYFVKHMVLRLVPKA